MSKEKKSNTFHLAITMAGAVSAGAYTAGVMDYLIEVLDKWEALRVSGNHKDKIPTHNIKIEVLSGASAGGMTACISSIFLHQGERNPVSNTKSKDKDGKKNRLYNSWVNLNNGKKSLDKNDAIFELLGNSDVHRIESLKQEKGIAGDKTVSFPISLFNSSIIRDIAESSTNLSDKEKLECRLPKYVAEDFDVFVTLTSLKGFPKRFKLKKNGKDDYKAEFSVVDHRDLVMFNFGKDFEKDGIVNIDLVTAEKDDENLKILRNAAVSTGAFPIGLEYGFVKRSTKYINKNFLMKHIHQPEPNEDIVEGNIYSSAMIDGGLINNEPFELTELLLKERLKATYADLNDKALKNKYSMLLIDPFPSKPIDFSVDNGDELGAVESFNQFYPFSLKGAIGQLVSVARSQLLVKNLFKQGDSTKEVNLIEKALDEDEINTFLISPRRYSTTESRIAEGDKAIACGTLYGFGGFLDKRFREHDFFLGRANCQSFLQKHFKFKVDELDNPDSPFYKSYSKEAKDFFLIKNENTVEDKDEWLPIVPNVNLLNEDVLDKSEAIAQAYKNNEYPTLNEREFRDLFNEIEPKLSNRIDLIKETFLDKKTDFFTDIVFFLNDLIDKTTGKNFIFEKLKPVIYKNLQDWKIIK